MDNAFVGFVSKGELVLVEYFMGEAIHWGGLWEWEEEVGRMEGVLVQWL